MRRAAKKDANHETIAAAFRKLGYSVLDLSRQGDDCPDMLCAKDGLSVLVEAKMPKGKLTSGQRVFVANWRGAVEVARSVDDVLAIHRRMLLSPLKAFDSHTGKRL
jgi:hypothetical protein